MRWILDFVHRRRRNREIAEEVEAHVEERIDDLVEAGMPEREARQKARREFGNATLVVETSREVRGWTSLERLAQDVRYAVRTLRKNPGFTAAAVACLALGIGANTAIFSLIDAVLLRKLTVREPERLVAVRGNPSAFSYPQFIYLREHTRTLDLAGYDAIDLNLSTEGVTDAPSGLLVSANYFSALGVQPALGRTFAGNEDAVAVISHRFWRSRFGSDPGIVGRTANLNGLSFTIIGVTPPHFFGFEVGASPDIFVPLPMRDRLLPTDLADKPE